MSHPFIDALKNNDLDAVKALPKTDLHNYSILIQIEYMGYTNFYILYNTCGLHTLQFKNCL